MRHIERTYYNRRAKEYDDWYLGTGLDAARERPGWNRELHEFQQMVSSWRFLKPLDIACGTGFLTRHLSGTVTGIDHSAAMLEIARTRVPHARFVQADALMLPFRSQQFDGALIAHFYGHLLAEDRTIFVKEARRVARDLIFVDSALRPGVRGESIQERVLKDGSRYPVYKRYFAADQLLRESGATEILYAGSWLVAVLARGSSAPWSLIPQRG